MSGRRSAISLALAVALIPRGARATYSIVGTDTATRQVGSAGTSCVPFPVIAIYGSAPGYGAIDAQAALNQAARDRGVQLLQMNVAPSTIIAMITSPSFDPSSSTRQYGVVDLMGRSAGFTGTNTMPVALDHQGSVATFTYSAQGNILTGRAVIDQASAAFESSGCDLADKLMLALEAGAQNGQGDHRCTITTGNPPSSSAFIEVDREGEAAGSFLRLEVNHGIAQPITNPLPELRQMFNAWRQTHACPASGPDAGVDAGDGGAGSGGAGGSGGGGAGGSGGGGSTSHEGGCSVAGAGAGPAGSLVLWAIVIVGWRPGAARRPRPPRAPCHRS